MEVEYIKGLGCPVNIIWGNEATAITITDAKQLQAKLAQVIEQAENEPEPELSEFEQEVRVCITKNLTTHIKDGNGREMSSTVFIDDCTAKKLAEELLSLARDQFIKDGYVIEKKAFKDAVEKVAPEVMKEVSDKVDMEEALRLGYEKGRADALKDLPRWEKCGPNTIYNTKFNFVVNGVGRYIVLDGYMIDVDRLEKLPGFKEDER